MREPSHWRTCITGYAAQETAALIHNTTDWDQRGYTWFSTWKPTYRRGDKVVLFDLTLRAVHVVSIKDTTKTPSRTPDGCYFAAYRQIRGIPRRHLVPRRWKALKAAGLLRRQNDANLSRKLLQNRFNLFVEVLKKQ